ncbi:ABC transporter permease [Inconstantimicrobium mannanitabidum]|uniref:Permease n=1 Tax=Inconstantimicrobium mannanitabidum TaxID=1604901 RepID=A0ACB5RD90_9CLOT|nr:ABC transporter permease [Clostridium sp. TW13]GKX67120.1 permease [Clostridium sp. TW13]
MRFLQIIKIALKNIKSNKLRSLLTMIGIVIGISSVIVMVAIGNGSSKSIMSQVQSLGSNLITLSVNASKGVTPEDITAIKAMDGVKNASPIISASVQVKTGTQTTNYSVNGVNEDISEIRQLNLNYGRFISQIDVDNRSKVVVIGDTVAQDIFGRLNPINQYIKLNGDEFMVVGVLKSVGSSMAGNIDNTIIMPISTAQFIAQNTKISTVYIEATNESSVDSAMASIDSYMTGKLSKYGAKPYNLMSQQQLLDTMSSITKTLSLLLGGIAGISLIVGGIGVMNVMLVSVTERTKEIGIRKALGGKQKDILKQFLIEALVLSSIGGILGVALGIGVGDLLNSFGVSAVFSLNIILIAFGFSMAIGIIFGLFPAYKASKLKPIDALRYE